MVASRKHLASALAKVADRRFALLDPPEAEATEACLRLALALNEEFSDKIKALQDEVRASPYLNEVEQNALLAGCAGALSSDSDQTRQRYLSEVLKYLLPRQPQRKSFKGERSTGSGDVPFGTLMGHG